MTAHFVLNRPLMVEGQDMLHGTKKNVKLKTPLSDVRKAVPCGIQNANKGLLLSDVVSAHLNAHRILVQILAFRVRRKPTPEEPVLF
jgi:hypothetical protein